MMSRLILTVACFAAVGAGAPGAPLRAGTAKVEITPETGLPLWGFFNRKTPAQGAIDPLYARVLVLEAGTTRVALVALDLGRVFGPASLSRLRELARRDSGISYALVMATHTHSAPVILDEYPHGEAPPWERATVEKVAGVIHAACGRLQEARIGAGYGVAYIGHNRLRVNPEGRAEFFERNTTQIPTSPVDPTVSVLRVDNAAGRPLAILVNYACHPVVFGSDNLRYSGDFPAVTVRTVESAFEPAPLCMFVQGADGDINPYYAVTKLNEDALKQREWTGVRLGEAAVDAARQIRTESASPASLQYAEDVLHFRLRWDADAFRNTLLKSLGPDAFSIFAPRVRETIEAPVATLLINKSIALLGVPGEPFVDLQTSWRDRCPVRKAFFAGYANGYVGYFPTIEAATRGSYGAANIATWVEVGAGERMVDHGLVRLYEMLGKLDSRPQ